MSTESSSATLSAPARPAVNYLNADYGWKSWLFTTDHKRIAILYLVSISVFFLLGGIAATLVRFNLISPQGAILNKDSYNRTFTMHGVMMVFFFLIPAVPAVAGNFVLPMMLGARDLAFPKLNLASWYIFVAGAMLAFWSMLAGGVDTAWTFYTPYSTNVSHTNVLLTAVGILIAGFSSILTGLNFLVTTHRMRAPGQTWFRLPLFVWTLYATSIVQLLGTPVLAMLLILTAVERMAGIGIFNPKLGGDPLLFQHLFWFYSHPAVYIMILPGMGVTSEIISTFSRKHIFGYHFVALASLAIALFGFLVWGHHMFVSGQSVYASMVFSVISFLVAVPSAVKVFNWTATLYRGSIVYDTPMVFAVGFIALFTVGGMTGLFLACLGTDIHLHDTYFIVAHFHFIMVGGMLLAYMAALHYWWPKATGRMYSEAWGRTAAVLIFTGFILTFIPQFIMGYHGMPRRYPEYPAEFQALNIMSSAGATVLAVGYLLPLFYLMASLFMGREAGPNPWGASGLEWQTPSPPPTENFPETPTVTCEPYYYGAKTTETYDDAGTTTKPHHDGGKEP